MANSSPANPQLVTSYNIRDVIIHGGGIANSCTYPEIYISFKITFRRSSLTSKIVSWEVTDVVWKHDSDREGHYDYPFQCYISMNANPFTGNLLVNKTPSGTVNWEAYVTTSNLSGTFESTAKTAFVRLYVPGGTCKNNDVYCFGTAHENFLAYTTTFILPDYSSSSSGGGSGSGGGTGYKIIYDANYGINAPADQSRTSGSTVTLSTNVPQYPINIAYYTEPEGTWGEPQVTKVIYREFLGWKAYYSRTNKLKIDETCDGETYNYLISGALPYDVKEVTNKEIKLQINSSKSITMYHWSSGKKPQDVNYPYYYSLEQLWREPNSAASPSYDIKDTRWIHTGTLNSSGHGVYNPKSPPAGSVMTIDYTSIEYKYSQPSDAGLYQKGDSYTAPSAYDNQDVYMVAQWGDAKVIPVPMTSQYKTVNFEYNGGIGPYPSKQFKRTELGYKAWLVDWHTYKGEGGLLPGPYYQVGSEYTVITGSIREGQPEDAINVPCLNRRLSRTVTLGMASVRDDYALVRREDLPVPTKTGSVFEGWYYDSACTQPVDEITRIGRYDPDPTFYAKYTEIPIKQFKVDGTWKPYAPKVWRFNGTSWEQVAKAYKFVDGEWKNISGGG